MIEHPQEVPRSQINGHWSNASSYYLCVLQDRGEANAIRPLTSLTFAVMGNLYLEARTRHFGICGTGLNSNLWFHWYLLFWRDRKSWKRQIGWSDCLECEILCNHLTVHVQLVINIYCSVLNMKRFVWVSNFASYFHLMCQSSVCVHSVPSLPNIPPVHS